MWTLPQKVRDTMGIDLDEIMDDRQIEEHIRMAQEQIKEELFIYHYNEEIGSNPDTGSLWDGSNVTFQTYNYPIMDSNYNMVVDSDDVTVRWLDNSYNPNIANVTVSNATFGILNVTQTNTSAIPSDAKHVYVEYYSHSREISKVHLENLTSFLTAYFIENTFKSGTSINMEDLSKNEKILLQSPDIFLRKYQRLLNQLQRSTIKGV